MKNFYVICSLIQTTVYESRYEENSSGVVKEPIHHRNYGVHTLSNWFALIQHAVGESHYIEGIFLALEIFRHTLQCTCYVYIVLIYDINKSAVFLRVLTSKHLAVWDLTSTRNREINVFWKKLNLQQLYCNMYYCHLFCSNVNTCAMINSVYQCSHCTFVTT